MQCRHTEVHVDQLDGSPCYRYLAVVHQNRTRKLLGEQVQDTDGYQRLTRCRGDQDGEAAQRSNSCRDHTTLMPRGFDASRGRRRASGVRYIANRSMRGAPQAGAATHDLTGYAPNDPH